MILRFAIFLNEKLDLCLCFAFWPFSTVLETLNCIWKAHGLSKEVCLYTDAGQLLIAEANYLSVRGWREVNTK